MAECLRVFPKEQSSQVPTSGSSQMPLTPALETLIPPTLHGPPALLCTYAFIHIIKNNNINMKERCNRRRGTREKAESDQYEQEMKETVIMVILKEEYVGKIIVIMK